MALVIQMNSKQIFVVIIPKNININKCMYYLFIKNKKY